MRLSIELSVQFRDIDRMGHANHAVYLQYKRPRVELARRLGMIRDVSSSSFIVARPITSMRDRSGTSVV